MYLIYKNESHAYETRHGFADSYATMTPIAIFSTKKQLDSFTRKLEEIRDKLDELADLGESEEFFDFSFEVVNLSRIPKDPKTITKSLRKKVEH